jgi:hypothetical protein
MLCSRLVLLRLQCLLHNAILVRPDLPGE